jgi:hypothetical protein
MKKQDACAKKLAFNKEKVTSLSPADLDQLHGGQESPAFSRNSSQHNFSCCACTTVVGVAEEG